MGKGILKVIAILGFSDINITTVFIGLCKKHERKSLTEMQKWYKLNIGCGIIMPKWIPASLP